MTRDQMLERIAQIHSEWAPTARVVVDSRYAKPVGVPSQYAENIEAVSAVAEDDLVAIHRINTTLYEYYTSNGMKVPGWLDRFMTKKVAARRLAQG